MVPHPRQTRKRIMSQPRRLVCFIAHHPLPPTFQPTTTLWNKLLAVGALHQDPSQKKETLTSEQRGWFSDMVVATEPLPKESQFLGQHRAMEPQPGGAAAIKINHQRRDNLRQPRRFPPHAHGDFGRRERFALVRCPPPSVRRRFPHWCHHAESKSSPL